MNKIKMFIKKSINLVLQKIGEKRRSRNLFWIILIILNDFIIKIRFTHSLQSIFEPYHLGGYVAGGDSSSWYPELWDWIIKELGIKSVIDVGCGEGHSTKYFKEKGCKVLGVEGSQVAIKNSPVKDLLIRHDYTKGSFSPDNEYDLVWSCEFVEHVEEKYVHNFLETFKALKYVFMTHAPLGKERYYHHVNCQPKEYWIKKLSEIGFKFDNELTQKARKKALHGYFEKTGLVFKRESN